MAYFLAKSEPQVYSIAQLECDGQTVWDGVKNAQAVAVIKTMQPGDIVLIYHSGGESAIVGTAEVVSEPCPDPNEPKSWVVDLRYRGRVEPTVTLRQVKASGKFADFNLVRHSRLSTMTVPPAFIDWLRAEYGATIP
ncbi:MAG TPA: EVE domain-containing protein [Thermomicrobiales bacterium]|jgi:predicted RNA-binding protein with PUA-like domain